MSENLNKKALVEVVADKLGKKKKDTTIVVDAIFDEIINTLADGGKVDISGFGKFEVTERAQRTGINPSTKEEIVIPASKAPKFRASKALKDAVK